MTRKNLSAPRDQTQSQDNGSSVYIIFQQPPYSCPFVHAVVRNESEADDIVKELSGGSSLYKFWKEQFEVR